jgi:hypothetical protein
MRAWIIGGILTATAAGGVYIAVAGTASRSHCGPCLKTCCTDQVDVETFPPGDSVVSVVDLNAALAPSPAKPNELPFISFDEPPLAKPAKPMTDAAVQQTTFIAPIIEDGLGVIEVAPPPRSRPTEPGKLPLYSPADPF